MKKTDMMATISLGGGVTYVLPLEDAVEVMKLLSDAAQQAYRKVDGEYTYVILPQHTMHGAIEIKTLSFIDYTKQTAMGQRHLEEEPQ